MPLACRDDMVGAFATDRSDQPFGEAVLPRRTWRDRFVMDTRGFNATPYFDDPVNLLRKSRLISSSMRGPIPVQIEWGSSESSTNRRLLTSAVHQLNSEAR